jgi:outer membrane protein TolC
MQVSIKISKIIFCLFLGINASAQTKDSILYLKDVMKQVYQFHPLAAMARNLTEQGKADLLFARGNYDVSFEFEATQKVYKNTNYYSYIDQGLKVPTWFGPELKAGYERNDGQYTNPSDYTPEAGLAYVGFYLPIGRSLIYDERRAAVQQAQLGQSMSENEKVKAINKLTATVSKDYWDWYFQYSKYTISKGALAIASYNYKASIERYKQGDLAPIDTLEAFGAFQQRSIDLSIAENDQKNARLTLSAHFWGSDNVPLEIESYLKPQEYIKEIPLNDKDLESNLEYVRQFHPEILKMKSKVRQLELEKKLRTVHLIPNVITSYRYLTSDPLNAYKNTSEKYLRENYKIGLYIYQPLFWRKDRAKYQSSKLKLLNIKSEQQMQNRELENNLRSSTNDVNTLDSLISLQEKIANAYQKLALAERAKFENGESNVFMVNSRETKALEGMVKLKELHAKHEKAKAYLMYATGRNSFQE